MFVVTGKSQGTDPFSLTVRHNDLDTTRRICRSLVALPHTEFIGLYDLGERGELSLVESWEHTSSPMPIAGAEMAPVVLNGATPSTPTPETVQADSEGYDFYCVKCKDKRHASGEVVINAKGRRMAKGICPVCGTGVNRMLPNEKVA